MQSFFIFSAESVEAGMKLPSAVPAPSLDASSLDALLPDRQITPVLASSHQAFKTPLTSWLITVAQAAPATPAPNGTMNT